MTPSLASPLRRLPPGDVGGAWREGAWVRLPMEAVLTWIREISPVLVGLLLVAGTLRWLGVDVSAPVSPPWSWTNPLAYWRGIHGWRSKMFRAAWFDELGWSGPAAVFAVFVLSGLQHRVGGGDLRFMVRWVADGAVAALFWIHLQRRAAARAEAYVRDGSVRRPAAAWGVLGAVIMVVWHGLLAGIPGLELEAASRSGGFDKDREQALDTRR